MSPLMVAFDQNNSHSDLRTLH